MRILSAYAVFNSAFHPMYPSAGEQSTGLIRLGRKMPDADWDDTSGEGVAGWRQEASVMLDALAAGSDDVQEASDDTSPPANSVSKGLPWYVVFEVTDPFDGAREIWAGRFMPDTVQSGETLLEAGVFFTFEGQGVFAGLDQEGPIVKPLRADKSILFPTYSGTSDETSAAKEQGCSLDDSRLRTDWPIHE